MVDRLHTAYLNLCYHWLHKRVKMTWPLLRYMLGWAMLVGLSLFLLSCQMTWILPLMERHRG
jgi:hypothetical protein